ncbi:MAG: deoxyribonuclease IV [Kiritimatiellae bacterium]|nr:deoxyribonuclease IV [Kiritimatiellia bacterium]MBR3776811.1 deoxyribonuclease IV [Kiritimatiellia bacterium]
MMKIGCHLSSSGGYMAMGQTAVSIGANVFQFFTRNPRGGAAKPIDKADVAAFNEYAAANGIGPILAHAPYTLNAAGSEERVREFAEMTMADDLKRLELTPGALYNFHPGSHVGQGAEKGIELIAGMLKRIFNSFGSAPSTTVLLETMAGKGSEIGRDFAELRAIMDLSGLDLGVCLDTCHVWDGGYDIVGNLDGVLDEFDRVIGLDKLKAIHLNDTMNAFAAHKDRHEKIGKGKIGLEAFERIVNHPKLRDLPFYLETPCDLQGYKEEIALLKGLRK